MKKTGTGYFDSVINYEESKESQIGTDLAKMQHKKVGKETLYDSVDEEAGKKSGLANQVAESRNLEGN